MASRENSFATSLAESTTTSATAQDKVSLTFTGSANKTYWIFASFMVAAGSGNQMEILFRDDTDAVNYSTLIHDARDATDYEHWTSFVQFAAGASPSSKTFKIQFRRTSGSGSVAIKEAVLYRFEVGDNDEYAESAATATDNTNNGVAVDGVALTVTPAAGNYLLVGCCTETSGAGGGQHIRLRGDTAGVTYNETERNKEAAANPSFYGQRRLNLAASSQTFSVEVEHIGDVSSGKEFRIGLINLDDLPDEHYAESTADSTTTSTTYQDKVSLTATLADGQNHIFIGCHDELIESNTQSIFTKWIADAADLADENLKEARGSAADQFWSMAGATPITGGGSSVVYKTQFRTQTSATARIRNATIAILQLDEAANVVITVPQGDLALDEKTAVLDRGLAPGQVDLSLTTVTAVLDRGLLPGQADLTLDTKVPTLARGLLPDQADLTLDTKVPTLARGLLPGQADLTLTTEAVSIVGMVNITVPQADLTLTPAAAVSDLGLVPAQADLTLTPAAATLDRGLLSGQADLVLDTKAAVLDRGLLPGQADLTLTPAAAATLDRGLLPGQADLVLDTKAAVLDRGLLPGQADLVLDTKAAVLDRALLPSQADLTLATFAAQVAGEANITVPQADLTLTADAATLNRGLTPGQADLSLTTATATLNRGLLPAQADLIFTTFDETTDENAIGLDRGFLPGQADLTLDGKVGSFDLGLSPAQADLILDGKAGSLDLVLDVSFTVPQADLVLDGKTATLTIPALLQRPAVVSERPRTSYTTTRPDETHDA